MNWKYKEIQSRNDFSYNTVVAVMYKRFCLSQFRKYALQNSDLPVVTLMEWQQK